MKIIFFGLGSIGQRHANILIKNFRHDLYAFRSDTKKNRNHLGIKEIYSWSEVKDLKPDVAFVTNPTNLHIETALKCAQIGCRLFIEKPVDKNAKNLNRLIKIINEQNLVSYVAYHLRFHPVIKELKKYTKKYKVLHIRAICTSYLPNWRPQQNHLQGYSANSRMGGGVILDLSHELDYISYLVNSVNDLKGNFSVRSNVTVDAEDYADILATCEDIPVNIHINFLSQLRQRCIQIDFDQFTLIGDIINSDIKEYRNEALFKSNKLKYNKGQEYEDQLKYFFKNANNPKMMNNINEASNLFKKIVNFKHNG